MFRAYTFVKDFLKLCFPTGHAWVLHETSKESLVAAPGNIESLQSH